MSFSSRRRNYLLTPHRRDGLIEWMKSMLQHSFVLDALETSACDTFRHFEVLIEEHRALEQRLTNHHSSGRDRPRSNSFSSQQPVSRLRQLVPTIGSFHTELPLTEAFEIYNEKHQLTKRKHIQISFNEIRHILNLAQIIALRKKCKNSNDQNGGSGGVLDETEYTESGGCCYGPESAKAAFASSTTAVLACSESVDLDDDEAVTTVEQQQQLQQEFQQVEDQLPRGQLNGPRLISFDGDQTLYSDGANFESNPRLAFYLYQLLRHGVAVAVVTAAGYEYQVSKYEHRLSGLLHYFAQRGLSDEECSRFFLFGGECNYLCNLGPDYRLHPVKETGPGGWCTATRHLIESPSNWPEAEVKELLDVSEASVSKTLHELNLRGRVIRKRRAVGLVPKPGCEITRESLDEAVLRVHEKLQCMNEGRGPTLPYCAFNGGSDAWVDVGNKRVGVQILQAYLGISAKETLHIGDQFLNTGNDYAARDVSPCVWIINPQETTYVLKSILRLAGVQVTLPEKNNNKKGNAEEATEDASIGNDEQQQSSSLGLARKPSNSSIDFSEIERRRQSVKEMDVYTGELVSRPSP